MESSNSASETRNTEKESPLSEPLNSKESLNKFKFEVYGEEIITKEVKQSRNSGRIYLPPDWIGKQIKLIRID
ncbi:MAG: hypothetical protein A4E66_01983 [Syntrophus sp. PtaB.Bin001]|jgi:hypothetical protein|nr:MAG: hypothetical protein A4E66_01983 [Syntrophus sp. PtaB.Bin001]